MYIFKATNKTKSKFAPEWLLGHEDFASECTMFRTYSYEGLNNDEFINDDRLISIKRLLSFPIPLTSLSRSENWKESQRGELFGLISCLAVFWSQTALLTFSYRQGKR